MPFICATMGRRGSRAYCNGTRVECAPFLNKDTIETTGAGDTFMACVLNWVLDYGINAMDAHRMHDMLGFANAASSIITTRKGALRVMPEESEVWGLIHERRKSEKEI